MCSSERMPRIYAPGKALESCLTDSPKLQEKMSPTCPLPVNPADTVTQTFMEHQDNRPRGASLTHSLPFLVRAVSQTWHAADELRDKRVKNDRRWHCNDLSAGISFSKQTKLQAFPLATHVRNTDQNVNIVKPTFLLLGSIYVRKIMLEITPQAGAWLDNTALQVSSLRFSFILPCLLRHMWYLKITHCSATAD